MNSGWRTVSWGPSTTSGQWPWFYSLTLSEPATGIGRCSDGVRTSPTHPEASGRQNARSHIVVGHSETQNVSQWHRWSLFLQVSGCSQLEEDPLHGSTNAEQPDQKTFLIGFWGVVPNSSVMCPCKLQHLPEPRWCPHILKQNQCKRSPSHLAIWVSKPLSTTMCRTFCQKGKILS